MPGSAGQWVVVEELQQERVCQLPRSHDLSPEEQKALVYAREIGALNNALYRAINRIEAQPARRDLHRLRDRGLLRQRGQGRGTYYTLPRALQATFPGSSTSLKPSELEAKPSELEAKPSELEAKRIKREAEPSELEAKRSELEAKRSELADLPQDLLLAVAQLAGRAAEGKIRAILLRLCALRPMTAEDLGRILDRNPVSLRYRHLRPLIQDGRLQYRFPEDPTHPLQAYVTVGSDHSRDTWDASSPESQSTS